MTLCVILSEINPYEMYKLIFVKGLQCNISFETVEPKHNIVSDVNFDGILIESEHISCEENEKNVINLSSCVRNWINSKIIYGSKMERSYRFKELPYMIAISIDPEIIGEKYIDVSEAIGFQSLNDPVQKIFTWDIQSIVLYDGDIEEYYALIKDDDDKWIKVSQSSFPANQEIDMANINVVKKISREIRTVFYKIK